MHRHIRHLRLSCTHEDHAQHGRILLEDAMRTATLGDEGRLIIVRRLALGRLPLRASATEWSLRLEQSFRPSRPVPVSFDQPDADHAPAVYFIDRHEPWLALAQRVAANRVCREWFWKPALPGWHPGWPAEETLRFSFRSLARHGGLPLTLVLASRLRAIGALTPLLESLRAADLAALRADLGVSEAEEPRPSEALVTAAAVAPSAVATLRMSAEAALVQSWGARDARTLWLAAVHLMPVGAAAAAPGSPPPRIAPDMILERVQQWTAARAQAIGVRPESKFQPPATPVPAVVPHPTRPPESERQFTRAGGLFFVIPLLVRVRLPEFLANLPDEERTQLPWQVLRLVLAHSRIGADDPLAVAVRDVAPARRAIGCWLIAAHRVALRIARLNLRQLAVRPALVTLSSTHIDLFFHPGDADIRLRRAGLDLDPGWVPWLGRVFAYHFNRDT